MATKRRVERLEEAMGDPTLPSRAEMEAAGANLVSRARERLVICVAAAQRGEALPQRAALSSAEITQEKIVRRWNEAHGISSEGACEELVRRIQRIAEHRQASLQNFAGAGN
jgi:hypothetical protein